MKKNLIFIIILLFVTGNVMAMEYKENKEIETTYVAMNDAVDSDIEVDEEPYGKFEENLGKKQKEIEETQQHLIEAINDLANRISFLEKKKAEKVEKKANKKVKFEDYKDNDFAIISFNVIKTGKKIRYTVTKISFDGRFLVKYYVVAGDLKIAYILEIKKEKVLIKKAGKKNGIKK